MRPHICALLLICSAGQAQTSPSCTSLDNLQWLLGNWQTETASGFLTESWQAVSTQTFEGLGTTLTETGTVREQESLRLVTQQDRVFYLAKVSAHPMPIPFRAERCDTQEAVFENPAHDFPQRIHYRSEDGALHVRIETLDGHNTLKWTFKRQP
ncbi:DUF6265 family protein [Aestuariibacter halophilus]|uniref:DUF6265 family protein n=1 Tax=Fluctibacter halophilus TaxID=226011 RepID=A0ABS8G2R2_9ALTE|nr:DUF6265 family protein [Aestuariibacter halophilus]MCC2614718.1 DUF6265 family protein [Aestuariibacter halophilus]